MKRRMIEELLLPGEMEKMLRDSYANYVVQTCLDHADPQTQERLLDAIRPLLTTIRSTPYGRRIANKVDQRTNAPTGRSNPSSATNTPTKNTNAPTNGYPSYMG